VDEPELDLDLLASSLHADDSDVQILLKALVERLSGALGSRLSIVRARGRLFAKSDKVERMTINLGDDQFDATVEGMTLRCTIARSSGGIRIRSVRVSAEEWLRGLLASLASEAATSEQTRLALESIVIGGT
jgi:hypothetical protein